MGYSQFRMRRVSDLIQRELAVLIQQKTNDPRFHGVAITRVELSRDFAIGRIYITTLNEQTGPEVAGALNKAAGFLRHHLAERLELRITPQLKFFYDEAIIKAEKLSHMIDQAVASDEQQNKKDEDNSKCED